MLKLRVFCWFVTGFAYIECRSEKDLEAALAKNKNFIGELFALHTCIETLKSTGLEEMFLLP